MRAPAYYPLRTRTNADFDIAFTFINSDGTPTDVTAWTPTMQVYDDVNGTLVMDVAVSGAFVNGGAAGTITSRITERVWSGIPPGMFRYDFRAIDGAGNTVAWFAGPAINEQGVTLP